MIVGNLIRHTCWIYCAQPVETTISSQIFIWENDGWVMNSANNALSLTSKAVNIQATIIATYWLQIKNMDWIMFLLHCIHLINCKKEANACINYCIASVQNQRSKNANLVHRSPQQPSKKFSGDLVLKNASGPMRVHTPGVLSAPVFFKPPELVAVTSSRR